MGDNVIENQAGRLLVPLALIAELETWCKQMRLESCHELKPASLPAE
jgi:hypothetical protein